MSKPSFSADTTTLPSDTHSTTVPAINTTTTEASSTAPSNTSFDDVNDPDREPISTLSRPVFASRKSSGTNIIPRDHPDVEMREETFPPGDARAMSPRRTSLEVEQMGRETRMALHKHARTLQSGLNALAEKIEMVKSDHDKLERQNLALQDYIGGLTRSIRADLATPKGKK